jgi:hypothetical protein
MAIKCGFGYSHVVALRMDELGGGLGGLEPAERLATAVAININDHHREKVI